MRGRIALPKHFVRNVAKDFAPFRGSFGVRARPRVAFGNEGKKKEMFLKENRDDQDRQNIDDLDHGIDRRTSGVFVRIAYCVACYCCGVRK